jgi:hypothetical protein
LSESTKRNETQKMETIELDDFFQLYKALGFDLNENSAAA